MSKFDSKEVEVNKDCLLKLFDRLEKVELKELGKFMLISFTQTDELFFTLHKEPKRLLEQENSMKEAGKCVVTRCICSP